jgi:hypothetical protein
MVLCKWFTAMLYEEKPVTRTMIIEKSKSFYSSMKINYRCAFSEGRNKKLPVGTYISMTTV